MRSQQIIQVVMTAAVATIVPAAAQATPSTIYWAPSVATCQAFGVPHITYDTYASTTGAYPIDTGLTVGLLPGNKVQAEAGFDLLLPGQKPTQFYVNGKVCIPEKVLGAGAPGISVGMYTIGFKKDVTSYNVLHVMVQKSLPVGGSISGGFYMGTNDALFTNSDGEVKKTGLMAGWVSPDIKVGLKGLSKINIIGDVITGKNILGGGGAGLNLYFNDYIALIVGPVFFVDKALQPGGARMLWTTQIDVDIPLGR